MDICPKCGLPIQACVCADIAKTEQQIEVRTIKKKFGKISTTISGLRDVDVKEIAKKLKEKFACGGTAKNGIIELQGDHKNKMRKALTELGFSESQIKD